MGPPPASGTLFCPGCGVELMPDVLRCASCGAPFAGSKARRALVPSVELETPDPHFDEDGELDPGGPRLTFRIDPK